MEVLWYGIVELEWGVHVSHTCQAFCVVFKQTSETVSNGKMKPIFGPFEVKRHGLSAQTPDSRRQTWWWRVDDVVLSYYVCLHAIIFITEAQDCQSED